MKQKAVLSRFVRLAYHAHPQYFYVMIVSSLITMAQTLFGAYTVSLLISCIEKQEMSAAFRMVLLIVAIETALMFFSKHLKRQLTVHRCAMEEAVNHMIAEKIMSLPFAYLEDPYYMELKKNSEMGINNMGAVYMMCESFVTMLANLLSILGLGMIIFTFDPLLIMILTVGIVLNLGLIFLSMKTQIRFFHDLLPINFKYGYYMDTIISEKNAKDFRLYSSFELIFDKFNCFAKEIAQYFRKLCVKQAMFQSLISTVRYVQMAFVYAFAGIRTIMVGLTIADFSLTVSAAISFSDCISKMIEISSQFIRCIEYVKPMLELTDICETVNSGRIKLHHIDSITFDHVSFAYPNTDKLILNDISFTIHKNEKISIVGLNGAGKTTIVKLLCRLYEPTSGQLLINGLPAVQYEAASYMSMISTVFQDYKMFAVSVKDNISFERPLEEAQRLADETGIGNIIEALPNQWASILSKAYDEKGVELSGGQTQKIAIARALAKPADLLILDEPTSALDPLAEAEIYENFNSLAHDRMAIYISHRMSSSIFCDKILVLDNGHISAFDTHQNLMKKQDSLYYQLFTTQAENYAI